MLTNLQLIWVLFGRFNRLESVALIDDFDGFFYWLLGSLAHSLIAARVLDLVS